MNKGTQDHPEFGTVSIQNGWVPAPGYVLRRHRILKTLESMPRGSVLDVGCGAGALLRDLNTLGFACTGLELGDDARDIARRICSDRPEISIHGTAEADWSQRFDYVASFEVLEHIEDDAAALQQWGEWLKPGGRLLLSVPAGPQRWNASDVWAGHYRRYTRESLHSVLSSTGWAVERMTTYGFPLSNAIEPVRALHHKRQLRLRGKAADDKQHGSVNSGIERNLETRLFPIQSSWFGIRVMRICCRLQEVFARTDLGPGYFVTAHRA